MNKTEQTAQAQETDLSLTTSPVEAVQVLEPGLSSQSANQVESPRAPYLIYPEEDVVQHELADFFPKMDENEFEQLKDSICADGQQYLIIMIDNKVVDGWHRLKACRELRIPAKAIQCQDKDKENIQNIVLSLNMRRRHLTRGQRSALGVTLLSALEREAAERKKAGTRTIGANTPQGKSVDLAGKQVGVDGKSVAKAKKIYEISKEIYQKLLNGKLTLPQAQKEVKALTGGVSQPESTQRSLLNALKEIIKQVSDEEKLLKIAEENPEAIKNALERLYEDGAGHESNDTPEANVDETIV